MPCWSDIYYLKKPYEKHEIPPLEKGLLVSVKWELKRPKYIHQGYIIYSVMIIDIIGDDVVAKTLKKIDHIRKNELMIFDKSYIYAIHGGWEYAVKYQYVRISRGVYFNDLPITNISAEPDYDPNSYGLLLYNNNEEWDDRMRFNVRLSIEQTLNFVPAVAEALKVCRTQVLFGDIFLPIDLVARDDDRDEWQYHDR